MTEAYIVDAVRTPVTRRGGGLASAHPADLGAHVIKSLLARTQADPSKVDDVVFGCVDTVGPGAGQQGRHDVRAQVGRVRAGQAAAAASDRGAHRVDNEGLGHPRLPV